MKMMKHYFVCKFLASGNKGPDEVALAINIEESTNGSGFVAAYVVPSPRNGDIIGVFKRKRGNLLGDLKDHL